MTLTADEKAARAAARKAKTAQRHNALRAEALTIANRLPPQYQDWGSMRVRAWERVSARLRGLAARKTLLLAETEAAMAQVKSVNDLTVEQCVELLRNDGGKP